MQHAEVAEERGGRGERRWKSLKRTDAPAARQKMELSKISFDIGPKTGTVRTASQNALLSRRKIGFSMIQRNALISKKGPTLNVALAAFALLGAWKPMEVLWAASFPQPENSIEFIDEKTAILTADLRTDFFELPEDITLIVHQNAILRATGGVILRGSVRVEPSPGAQPGSGAPLLTIDSEAYVVILGEMRFGDGVDGGEPGVMGGAGAALSLRAPIVAIGQSRITLGNGGRGGAGVEGGPGGYLEISGWLVPFHAGGLMARAGDGGVGGDGPTGSERHPRGFRGGDGGQGGFAMAYNPTIFCDGDCFDRVSAELIGIDSRLDLLVGPNRAAHEESVLIGGNGGDGGIGGMPWPEVADRFGGGRGGTGGDGGAAEGARGAPGADYRTLANPTGFQFRGNGGPGGPGGHAQGGAGGAAGAGGGATSKYDGPLQGHGGDGGRAVGGVGGNGGRGPTGKGSDYAGRFGPGGRATAGRGGRSWGNRGGDAGLSTQGLSGSEPETNGPDPE